ncbi:MAG: UDP-N-acetylmuramoyl-L-alanine--D-glutamate ligase [Lachnospiraceae bacterium]|nr:UDP-N-acetylmuramoyl-L-alanine--D-glutamate ligase [Lachnospiraceae bacterium]
MGVVDKLEGKRILIWGYGREGQSTKHFLTRCCKPAAVDIFEGKKEDLDDSSYDYVIKSPGIRMDEDDPKYTSQTELFLEEYRDRVIGVTGTKGKSTTSSMLNHVLTRVYPGQTILLGNIGEPCLNYFDEITPDTIVVFEMSCHQLAHVRVSPHIAIFLNLHEEHLDYYDTYENYFAAKRHITEYQTEDDYLLVGENVPEISTRAKVIRMPDTVNEDFGLKVLGKHNACNANFAVEAVSGILGYDRKESVNALHDFEGLPHRLSFIGEIDGIKYYDDSISTIPEATIQALESVPDAYTVLIGGMDRGINYDILVDYVREHPEFRYIFSYDSGGRIYDQVCNLSYTYYEKTLELAVKQARKITPAGKACILSPASASYGYFKNFEQRGEMFSEYVKLV